VLQRKKDIHMAALTGAELSSLPDDIPCYKPVGRSFVREPKPTIMSALEEQVKTASEEIEKTEGQKEHMQKVLNETETNIKELLQGNEDLEAVLGVADRALDALLGPDQSGLLGREPRPGDAPGLLARRRPAGLVAEPARAGLALLQAQEGEHGFGQAASRGCSPHRPVGSCVKVKWCW